MKEFGLQVFSVRTEMETAEATEATFKALKEMGYSTIQTAGCAIPYEEYGRLAKEAGLEIVGTHDNFQMMEEDFEQAVENHKLLGTTNMGIGGYFMKEQTVEVWEDFIKRANAVAKKCGEIGMKFTYHHHSHEFVKLENGKRAMDMLVEGLDPENTSFVLDTYWLQHGGADIYEWLEKLAGRVDILHLKDMLRLPHKHERYGYHHMTEVGNGNLNWKKIIEVAEKCGVKHYVVEQDACLGGDCMASMKQSADYLKTL